MNISNSAEYKAWQGMKSRCYNPHVQNYHCYGGRGITVCPEWRHSSATFLADMGPKLLSSHTLDRINNDGNYEPANCRWATWKQQALNRRKKYTVETLLRVLKH